MNAPIGNLAALGFVVGPAEPETAQSPQGLSQNSGQGNGEGKAPISACASPTCLTACLQQLAVTVFTSEKPATLTKSFQLSETGELLKSTSANLAQGTADVEAFLTMDDFARFLPTLEINQAITYGVVAGETPVKVVRQEEKEKFPFDKSVIARTKDYLVWNAGPGILMLDYDPAKSAKPLSRDELLSALTAAVPGLLQATLVWWMSASSNIYNGDKLVQGIGGQRVYIGVQNAVDIPRAGKAIADRLWLAGHGYFAVSKSAALLERTLVDTSVWQTNRFDFAAGARCSPPLVQRRGTPEIYKCEQWAGDLLDSYSAIPDIDGIEFQKLESLKAAERAKLKPEIEKAIEDFVNEQVVRLCKKNPDKPEEDLRETVQRAINDYKLMGDFEVKMDDGTMVSVAHLLDNREKYHRRRCYDPLEPEYDGGRIVGILYLDGARPVLVSQAHGKRVFKLTRVPYRIEVVAGETAALVDTVCDRMRNAPDIFDFGDGIATVSGGKVRLETENSLLYYLGSESQFYRAAPTKKNPGRTVNIDPPLPMVRILLDRKDARGLRKLSGVITAPTMRPDYSILDRPGYDKATKLFYAPDGDAPKVPLNPSWGDCMAAIDFLWQPFSKFPFVTEADRGALFSALLTAAVRPGIGPAPAHAFDAPSYGSGKTLLAKCLSVIAGGVYGKVSTPPPPNEDEIRKRILSMLAEGDTGVIWDNLTWPFGSQSVAALLTADYYTDRKLGGSENKTYPSRVLLLLTGNQLEITRDMMRRVITCRINSYEENAGRRIFTFDPLRLCADNRMQIIIAALTVIRFWHINRMQYHEHKKNRTASFEQWDDLVRQPICWMARERPGWIADPMTNVEKAQEEDPARFDRYSLLNGLRKMFGDNWFHAKEVVDYKTTPETYDAYDNVKESLVSLAPNSRKVMPFDSTFVGTELRKHREKVVSGLMLATGKDPRTKSAMWRIIALTTQQ